MRRNSVDVSCCDEGHQIWFNFRLPDGSELAGSVHGDWFQGGNQPRPMIKTLDLKSAYKQLALNELESRKSVFCLKCPDDGRVYGFACKTCLSGRWPLYFTSIDLRVFSEQFSWNVV